MSVPSSLPAGHQDLDLDWLPETPGPANLDERIEEARCLATSRGRMVAAQHEQGPILAAPHQSASEIRECHEANRPRRDPREAIAFAELGSLDWQAAPYWRRVHQCYRFEQRILKLEPRTEFLVLTDGGETVAIAPPAELRSEQGCAILQIQCYRDDSLDDLSYFFSFGERRFCGAERNVWTAAENPMSPSDDLRQIIREGTANGHASSEAMVATPR
ncbi:MAG TPA: hypothetical protein PLA50_09170 [Bacteroidia bacterium]|nr:hypothetical protein [Bacteroidia bacterium]